MNMGNDRKILYSETEEILYKSYICKFFFKKITMLLRN